MNLRSWWLISENTFSRYLPYYKFLIFLKTRSHIMTHCEGFPFFWFFWILYADFKMRSKLTTRPFLVRGWILRNYWCISDEIDSFVPKKDFFQKIMSKLQGSCSSNLTRFLLNRQKLVFFMRRVWKPLTHKYLVICT